MLSWNIKGLNAPEKRKTILRELGSQKIQIGFLQETHLRETGSTRLIGITPLSTIMVLWTPSQKGFALPRYLGHFWINGVMGKIESWQ